MTVGLMGGSFNPVHIGHMMVASYMAQYAGLDEVWMVLSPQNPLKESASLIDDRHRLRMLEIAVSADCRSGIRVCDAELSLPRPSYTIDTLRHLSGRYPSTDFRIITGSDNWARFSQWRESDRILSDYGVIVYPRPGFPVSDPVSPGCRVVDAPMTEISSTFIRQALSRGDDMAYFLPAGVYEYIRHNHLYE